MRPEEPSRTAWSAATHRALHQVLEGGRVFPDPIAIPILGDAWAVVDRESAATRERRGMRLFIACRHRFGTEVAARLTAAAHVPVQVLILGAGLDTTAYRPTGPAAPSLVVEVDHPATQAWKLGQLERTGLQATTAVAYLGVDFERDDLGDRLSDSPLEPSAPIVVLWLGVVPYLTREAVGTTLASLARMPGVHLVLDYSEPASALSGESRRLNRLRSDRVAALGEPWLSRFSPQQMEAALGVNGFEVVEDLGFAAFGSRYLGLPEDIPDRPGPHLLHAMLARRPGLSSP